MIKEEIEYRIMNEEENEKYRKINLFQKSQINVPCSILKKYLSKRLVKNLKRRNYGKSVNYW